MEMRIAPRKRSVLVAVRFYRRLQKYGLSGMSDEYEC